MATKKRGATDFEGRLSVRLSMGDLKWAARIGAMADQDSSWAVRWAINEARTRGIEPVLRTVQKGGGA